MLKSRTGIDEFTERDQEIMHSFSLSYELFNSMLKKVLRRLRLFLFIFKEVRSEAFLAVLLAEVPAAVLAAVLPAISKMTPVGDFGRPLSRDSSIPRGPFALARNRGWPTS